MDMKKKKYTQEEALKEIFDNIGSPSNYKTKKEYDLLINQKKRYNLKKLKQNAINNILSNHFDKVLFYHKKK